MQGLICLGTRYPWSSGWEDTSLSYLGVLPTAQKKSTVTSLQLREGKPEPYSRFFQPCNPNDPGSPQAAHSACTESTAGGGTPQTPALIISPSRRMATALQGTGWALSRRFRSFMETPRQSTRGAELPLSLRPRRGAPPAAALPAVPAPQPAPLRAQRPAAGGSGRAAPAGIRPPPGTPPQPFT